MTRDEALKQHAAQIGLKTIKSGQSNHTRTYYYDENRDTFFGCPSDATHQIIVDHDADAQTLDEIFEEILWSHK